jgi:hypothetical protein
MITSQPIYSQVPSNWTLVHTLSGRTFNANSEYNINHGIHYFQLKYVYPGSYYENCLIYKVKEVIAGEPNRQSFIGIGSKTGYKYFDQDMTSPRRQIDIYLTNSYGQQLVISLNNYTEKDKLLMKKYGIGDWFYHDANSPEEYQKMLDKEQTEKLEKEKLEALREW